MLRKVVIVLVVVLVLLGAGAFAARKLLVVSPPAPSERPRVADLVSQRTLPSGGDVVGYTGRYGSHVWLGIPYAEPPVGERRWRAPERPAVFAGTRDALAFGPHCPQLRSAFGGVDDGKGAAVTGDEDCLYLNVYAPQMEAVAAAQHRLPVMVWIHGGGNVVGLSDFYDGGRLAQSQDVIVVTVNYRLGPFGWFRHAALREGATPAEQSGNFATLDLVRALEWLRENVSAFGGDPGNVTIFGESAGGRNVVSLLLSPLAKGLFQRAIVQSGGTETLDPDAGERFADDSPPGHRGSSNEVLVRLLVAAGEAADRAAAKQVLASLPPRPRRGPPAQPHAGAGLRRLRARGGRRTARRSPGLRRRRRAAAGRRARSLRAARRLEPGARDGRHQPGRERALHVHASVLGETLARRAPAGARSGSLPRDGGGAQRAVEGHRGRRSGERDLAYAAGRLRLPLRLGRGAEPARHRPRQLPRRRARLRDPLRLRPLGSRRPGQRDLRCAQPERP